MDFSDKKLDLGEAIFKVVAFFNLFDYPVTAEEIWRFLNKRSALADVIASLESPSFKSTATKGKEIAENQGFYFLKGREDIINIRKQRYCEAYKKYKRVIFIAKVFKFIPWIKLIALGNMIGAHNLKAKSDLDLFIVTEKNKIWTTRFFCAGLIKVFKLRPTPKNQENKICLSFFVSEQGLNIRDLMLEDRRDNYFIYWLSGLVPIYDKGGIWDKFIKANAWLYNFLPNWRMNGINYRRDAGRSFPQVYEKMVSIIFGSGENVFKKIQLKILPADIKEMMNQDSRVVVNDQVLKFHRNDRRKKYNSLYENKLKSSFGKSN